MIELAKGMCIIWHGDQVRKYTGEPYYHHPFEVVRILERVGITDENTLAAAYLHDVVEDCGVTFTEIENWFNRRVAELVRMVTDVSKPEDGNRAVRKTMDKDHLAKADAAGQSIKLADLICNTCSITKYDQKFAKVYLAEKRELLKVLTRGDCELHAVASELCEG